MKAIPRYFVLVAYRQWLNRRLVRPSIWSSKTRPRDRPRDLWRRAAAAMSGRTTRAKWSKSFVRRPTDGPHKKLYLLPADLLKSLRYRPIVGAVYLMLVGVVVVFSLISFHYNDAASALMFVVLSIILSALFLDSGYIYRFNFYYYYFFNPR